MNRIQTLGALGVLAVGVSVALAQAPANMSFFVTSANPGKGGNLGGLAGADAHCQSLAAAVGAGGKTWHAYLSTDAVNAKDRIGKGPWHNAKGDIIGENVAELHSMAHRISDRVIMDERGRKIPGGGYVPNRHDVLTGTQLDGTAYSAGADMTCGNWTKTDDTGKARIGHFDRAAWNSAHDNRGCTAEGVKPGGGDGLFYCFAAD